MAARLLQRAAPVSFRVAASPDEIEAAYRLRYAAVIERGWARADQLPNGLERDEFDDDALHITGWDGNELAAAARLVLPFPGRALPTELSFDLEIEPRYQVVDLGRLVVARPYRSRRIRVAAGLVGSAWREVRARGFSCICGIGTPSMIRLYASIGLALRPLGPPRPHWGEDRYPVTFDVARGAHRLSAHWDSRD